MEGEPCGDGVLGESGDHRGDGDGGGDVVERDDWVCSVSSLALVSMLSMWPYHINGGGVMLNNHV